MHSNHKRFLYGHLQIDMYEKFRVFYDNYLKSHTEHGFWLVDNVNFVTPHYREIKLIIIVILFPFVFFCKGYKASVALKFWTYKLHC